MKLKTFIEQSNIPPGLIRAIVRQSNSWVEFQDHAADICNHGAAGGFMGFVYYNETISFFNRQRKNILALAAQQADDFGDDILSMIAGFNCLRRDELKPTEIMNALYSKGDINIQTQIQNTMSWYALEEVARAYVDACEAQSS